MSQLLKKIYKVSDVPTIVCGDFNDTPDSACVQEIENTRGDP